MANLTQELLKQYLHYDNHSGIFSRVIPSGPAKVGDICGTLSHGYLLISVCNHQYPAHRLAFLYMTGNFPKHHVDHIDHNRVNNKWSNLRPATNLQNHRNNTKSKNNTSGVTGVSWNPLSNTWRVRVMVLGKNISIGSYKSKIVAVLKSKQAYKQHGFHTNHGASA